MNFSLANRFWLSLVLLLCACEDLPKPTATGEQTFGCRVNGKMWKPLGQRTGRRVGPPTSTYMIRTDNGEYLRINAYSGEESVGIWLNASILGRGAYRLDQPYLCGAIEARGNTGEWLPKPFYDCTSVEGYFTDSLRTGEVVITQFDRAKGIVSGHFSFTAYNSRTNSTVEVTDGRFDLKVEF